MPVPISYSCPVCKSPYSVPDADAGKKSECSKCGQRIQVPAPRRNKTVLGELDDEPASIDAPQKWEREAAEPLLEPEIVPERSPGRDWDREQDDWEDYESRRRARYESRKPAVPGKVQAIAFMLLFGGGFAILWAMVWILLSGCLCFAWPGTYYSIVFGIMAIIRGSELLGARSRRRNPPRTLLIMQIICAVSADPINTTCGIVGLVFLNDPEVDEFFYRD